MFEGGGDVVEYVGGYTDWLRQRRSATEMKAAAPAGRATSRTASGPAPAKLSYKEQREIEALPARIEALEREQAELGDEVSQPGFYKRDAAEQARVQTRLAALPAELEAAYARWDELEGKRSS